DFGLPAPIDVQVVGVDRAGNLKIAQELNRQMKGIPGIADVHIHQISDYPTLHVDVDRVKASEVGLTQQVATNSILVSLSGTTQVTPNYWVNPVNRVNYVLAVQTPPYRIPSVDPPPNTPIISGIDSSLPRSPTNLPSLISGGPGSGAPRQTPRGE